MERFPNQIIDAAFQAVHLVTRYWVVLVILGYVGLIIKQFIQACYLSSIGFTVPLDLVIQPSAAATIKYCLLAFSVLLFYLMLMYLVQSHWKAVIVLKIVFAVLLVASIIMLAIMITTKGKYINIAFPLVYAILPIGFFALRYRVVRVSSGLNGTGQDIRSPLSAWCIYGTTMFLLISVMLGVFSITSMSTYYSVVRINSKPQVANIVVGTFGDYELIAEVKELNSPKELTIIGGYDLWKLPSRANSYKSYTLTKQFSFVQIGSPEITYSATRVVVGFPNEKK